MSKLIKSNNVKHPVGDEAKEIKVRSINKAYYHTGDGDVTDKANQEKSDVHYLERNQVLLEAEKEAEHIILHAQKVANETYQELELLKSQIAEEEQRRYEAATHEGYEKGYVAGVEAGKNTYVQEIEKAKEIIQLAKEDYNRHIQDSEPVMLELALEVAKKIVGSTLKETSDAWIHLVKEAISEVRAQKEITISVHPSNYQKTLDHLDEFKQIAMNTHQLLIYPNGDLSEGACMIETPFGQLEASVDSQLMEIKLALLEKLKEGVNQNA
ncbi:flagellar assembly protein FliH [Evansella sp. AB-rgal1]|uniref:flagellar assembly protein FliH n=1 Tax=Evansella sp. AB-rgal1 TaxID=3242696 RepID=UPI00359D8C0D